MTDLKEKKLLIIGGAFQHVKLVEAAKELGVVTYVTDYLPLEKAPAKQIADKYFMYNIDEIDEIVDMCKKEKIDGVISTSLDACQRPYQQICERLDLPCFGTKEQFFTLTDKTAFKKACIKYGLDVIPEYQESDFETEETCKNNVTFPIFIKPCDSRGSRGQSICNTYEEAKNGIDFAKSESASRKIVIEKYMGQANDFSMTILMLNGKAYPIRTVDRVLGKYEDGLDKLAVGAVMPSVFTNIYMEKAHTKVEHFYKSLGIENAPVFMQGFVDGDTVRFYDPGLRLPGGEYERVFAYVMGRNPLYPLIEIALTGKVSKESEVFSKKDVMLGGKITGQVLPTLKPGIISKISGVDEIRNHPDVVSVFERYTVGDEIKPTHNVGQRFAEINIVCDSNAQLSEVTKWVYNTLKIMDTNGDDMKISMVDPDVFLKRGE